MTFHLKEYSTYNEEEIVELYQSVGWSNYYNRPKMLREAYKSSLFILAAYAENNLVGIIRVVGDGTSIIYVQDILVHSNYQRQGIGRALVEQAMARFAAVYQKVLITDDSLQSKAFYESIGFKKIDEMEGVCFVSYTV